MPRIKPPLKPRSHPPWRREGPNNLRITGIAGCWVNKYGRRFCNEAFGVPFVAGCQSARQPVGSDIIQVWDEGHWREFAQNQALGHFNASDISDAKMDEYAAKLEEARAAGAEGANGVYCADDLETLAGYLGLEGTAAANFVESVERYSQFAEAGKDEDYAKPADMMWPVNEGPSTPRRTPATPTSCS